MVLRLAMVRCCVLLVIIAPAVTGCDPGDTPPPPSNPTTPPPKAPTPPPPAPVSPPKALSVSFYGV